MSTVLRRLGVADLDSSHHTTATTVAGGQEEGRQEGSKERKET